MSHILSFYQIRCVVCVREAAIENLGPPKNVISHEETGRINAEQQNEEN